ncbi:coiled-coil domain-containing protein 177 [Thunnus albacares]|uniref:coiled-coil domain-containing protein 177 n=1 Tax=Thunnus albacares TaxID=8236 RepID=UPI001CF711B8|nr:coiled-coil domain-containing protein 177 [Thunnus albacares]XP_044228681.1 coiled-coil domain-containing protein 177 [Thunnus albacares]
MGELRSTSPSPRLDLNNFDSAEAERSRYVLTSPRSLQSCARVGIKPVELLIKSLNELIAEQHDAPFEAVKVMHESYEKERRKVLQMCRDERERIIRAAGDRWPDSKKGLGTVPDTKLKNDLAVRESIPYADLCLKGKSVSRSSCPGQRDPDRCTVCSFRDLRHSPATEMKLERLTNDINKKMCVTIPERDRKIAALMLVKHQEEQDRVKLRQQEEQERQEARRQEEAQRAEAEKKRRKRLKQSMQHWHEELEARRRLRERQEIEKAGQLEQEVLLQEDRWRRLKEEVEAQRREKMEAAQKEAEARKCYQEMLLRGKKEVEKREQERERQVAVEKEQKARRSKVLQEKKERRRLQEENRKELLRHILLKRQVEQQAQEEEAHKRSTLERKLQLSSEKHAQAVGARLRELQERAGQEEKQIQRAQLRAELQSVQQLTHKQLLVQLSQRRIERAAQHTSAQRRERAQQTHQHNKHRQLCHLRLREKMQREEEVVRTVRESYITMKEWRRERLRRQREQIQEEAHKLARASFQMRERVRQQTQSRTFDQMALEAQLTASITRMKL